MTKTLCLLLACVALSVPAHAEDRLTLRDYTPLLAAGSFDLYTTVRSAGVERNPVIRSIPSEPTRLVVGAAIETGAFALAHKTLGKKHPKLVRAAILTATAVHLFVASHNLQNPQQPRR
jgi:hypothetical protein